MPEDDKFERKGMVHQHIQDPILNFYNIPTGNKNKLGEGSFGMVAKATSKATNAVFAVKSIEKKHLKDAEKFKVEIMIMKEMDHPNIVKLFETFEDKKYLYLVLELCEGGELFDEIIEQGCFSEHDAARYMSQILGAILYMHKHHITHRDLKPENFLLEEKTSKNKDAPIKVIDFGLSCKFTEGKFLSTKAGTPYYVAPQVLQGKYDEKADVWSCGVLMYVLLCGYPPFYGDNDNEILAMVKKGVFDFPEEEWNEVSSQGKGLVEKLLTFEPAKRPSCEEALKHDWFAKNADGKYTALKEQPLKALNTKLKSFHQSSKLKKVALTAIARNLAASQIKDLTEIFKALDDNNDGTLTYPEMVKAMEAKKIAVPEDLMALMKEIDSDGSGSIDYTEFVAATLDKRMYIGEQNLWQAFRVFDLDGDGKITQEELKSVLSADGVGNHLDNAKIKEMIAEADKNGDGQIDFEEFKAHMTT